MLWGFVGFTSPRTGAAENEAREAQHLLVAVRLLGGPLARAHLLPRLLPLAGGVRPLPAPLHRPPVAVAAQWRPEDFRGGIPAAANREVRVGATRTSGALLSAMQHGCRKISSLL